MAGHRRKVHKNRNKPFKVAKNPLFQDNSWLMLRLRLCGKSSIGESSVCGVLHHDGPDTHFFIVEAFYFVPCPVSAPLPPPGHLKGHRHVAMRPIVRFFCINRYGTGPYTR